MLEQLKQERVFIWNYSFLYTKDPLAFWHIVLIEQVLRNPYGQPFHMDLEADTDAQSLAA